MIEKKFRKIGGGEEGLNVRKEKTWAPQSDNEEEDLTEGIKEKKKVFQKLYFMKYDRQ